MWAVFGWTILICVIVLAIILLCSAVGGILDDATIGPDDEDDDDIEAEMDRQRIAEWYGIHGDSSGVDGD